MKAIRFSRHSRLDYQQVLHDIARSMVRLKRPERLLKMITRLIDRELGLTHTSFLIYQERKKCFLFVDSKGSKRFPTSLLRIDLDHPLVAWFQHKKRRVKAGDYVMRAELGNGKSRESGAGPDETERMARAMDDLRAELAVPGYYRGHLLGFLLLGRRLSGRTFTDQEISFFQILTQDCSMAIKTAEYHQHLLERQQELQHRLTEIERLRAKERETYRQIMCSLAQEVYVKDAYTYGHVNQVERLGMLTAKEMGLELSELQWDALSAGLILHDVGKIGIPDKILKKPDRLNPEEWTVMKTHVEKGAKILEPLSDFKEAMQIVLSHHENFDGSGYPRGLKGDEISRMARIVAVVDAFHAMVSNRCYSRGRSIESAFQELRQCAGSQFDPEVVEAFIRALNREMAKRGRRVFVAEWTRDSQEAIAVP